ncbi:MAG: N-6 DNA methylase [Rikenellaceae bacterium]
MAKKKAAPKEVRLEDILFECRNKLRGKADMTDKRDLLLTLVFFKFIGDRFEEQREAILSENKAEPDLAKILVDSPSSYGKDGVFYLKGACRWEHLTGVEAKSMAVAFDTAINILDSEIESLKNALPSSLFVNIALEPSVLKAVVDEVNKIDRKKFQEKDLIGRVYEYFLQAFSINADKEEGEFYTPHSIVELIATLIEPFDGTIYDPCCGSGGMFVQSAKFIEAHGGNTRNISVYGQESDPSTYRLAKMNLAVRGISYNLSSKATSTLTDDQHPDKKMDYIMANPPFNLKNWRKAEELTKDTRWKGYGVPPVSNANYAWILHILSKLNASKGVAGFLLANGALGDDDTVAIRENLIKNDKVEAIIVLPREMFYSTDISVTLWILNNNKRGGMWHKRKLRNRENEVLFVDLRSWGQNIYEKKYVKLSEAQIDDIHNIYLDWQMLKVDEGKTAEYAKPELYCSVIKDKIEANNWSLVPSRYIEFVDRDTELDYEVALKDAGSRVKDLIARQKINQTSLIKAFKTLGYDAE